MKKFKKNQLKTQITRVSRRIIKATTSYNERLLRTQLYALKCILIGSDIMSYQTDVMEK